MRATEEFYPSAGQAYMSTLSDDTQPATKLHIVMPAEIGSVLDKSAMSPLSRSPTSSRCHLCTPTHDLGQSNDTKRHTSLLDDPEVDNQFLADIEMPCQHLSSARTSCHGHSAHCGSCPECFTDWFIQQHKQSSPPIATSPNLRRRRSLLRNSTVSSEECSKVATQDVPEEGYNIAFAASKDAPLLEHHPHPHYVCHHGNAHPHYVCKHNCKCPQTENVN